MWLVDINMAPFQDWQLFYQCGVCGVPVRRGEEDNDVSSGNNICWMLICICWYFVYLLIPFLTFVENNFGICWFYFYLIFPRRKLWYSLHVVNWSALLTKYSLSDNDDEKRMTTMVMIIMMTMQVVAAYSSIASADFNSICSLEPKNPRKPSPRLPRSSGLPQSSATNALLIVALVMMPIVTNAMA